MTATRNPPDATAVFLASVRREIRDIQRLIGDADRLGVAAAVKGQGHWMDRAQSCVELLANEADEESARHRAIEACAALYFAARPAS